MSSAPTNPALTQPPTAQPPPPTVLGGIMTIFAAFGGFFAFLLHLSAAKLSYDKYQSPFWAVIDFIFGTIYIPYYAFFLNTPSQQPMMGGRRRR